MNYRLVIGTALGLLGFLVLAHFALWGLHAHWLWEFGRRTPVVQFARPQPPPGFGPPTDVQVETRSPAIPIDTAMEIYLEKGAHDDASPADSSSEPSGER